MNIVVVDVCYIKDKGRFFSMHIMVVAVCNTEDKKDGSSQCI